MSEPPTNEQVAIVVGNARDHMRSGYSFRVAAPGPVSRTAVIVALADENERLRADLAAMTASFNEATGHLTRLMDERAECLSLLEDIDVAGYNDGLGEWDEKRRALVSKLRGQQP